MEIVRNSQTRTTVKLKDKTVTIIGTAHISGDSVKEIDEVIDELTPDRICIELDESRFKTVSENRRWEKKAFCCWQTSFFRRFKSGWEATSASTPARI